MIDIFNIKENDRLVLKYPDNGYENEIKKAQTLIENYGKDPVFTVKNVHIGNWHTSIEFHEISGHWNSVQFDRSN